MIATEMLTDNSRRFKADLNIGNNGDGAKTAPVKVIARSGGAMEHPCWDLPVVHDFAGMQINKNRIPLDYEHCEEIGYLNKFDTSNGELVCSGAIVPNESNAEDTANTVIVRAT